MKYLIFFIICLQIFIALGEASYEDDDDEYVYENEDDYEYVDDCLDADDDGYCESNEDYTDEDYTYENLDEESEAEPEFGQDPTTMQVDMGSTARIICTVINLGSSVVSWKKDGSFLSLGGSLLSDDPRISISMTPSSSELTITLVKGEDAGDYVCQVATPDIMAKTFTIEIKSPPNVEIVNKPESSTYPVKEADVALKQLKEEEEESISSANRGQFLVGSLTCALVCLSLRALL